MLYFSITASGYVDDNSPIQLVGWVSSSSAVALISVTYTRTLQGRNPSMLDLMVSKSTHTFRGFRMHCVMVRGFRMHRVMVQRVHLILLCLLLT